MASENLDRLTRCEQLLEQAKSGQRLEIDDRRSLIAYLKATQPDMSNVDMGKLFGISEGQIRKDIAVIRKRSAEELTKDDIGLVVSDIMTTFDRVITEMEKSAKASKQGTAVYLQHKKAVLDYLVKKVEALQSLGYYPKNLGALTQTKFIFSSHVAKDGSVTTLPATDAEQAKVAVSKAVDNIQDAEFEDVVTTPKALPAGLDTVEMLRKQVSEFQPVYSTDTDSKEAELRLALAREFAETPKDMVDAIAGHGG